MTTFSLISVGCSMVDFLSGFAAETWIQTGSGASEALQTYETCLWGLCENR